MFFPVSAKVSIPSQCSFLNCLGKGAHLSCSLSFYPGPAEFQFPVEINTMHYINKLTRCHMSLDVRNQAFCISENKKADSLRSNCAADQRLCFRYRYYNPPTSLIQFFKPLAIFCCCTARFVSDLVGNPEDRFSHNQAHIYSKYVVYDQT